MTLRNIPTDAGLERDEIVRLDKAFLWHPYTPMGSYIADTDPLVIERALGSRLFDLDGRVYIDANASWWTSVLGHRHPRLIQALKHQADQLAHTSLAGITHEPAARLAADLVAISPTGLSHVFFSDNGSTSVEVAIKLAVQYFGQNGTSRRQRFVALEGAFHGETLGATALGGVEIFRRPFAGVVMDCLHVPPGAEGHEHAFLTLARLIEGRGDEIAAVVLEPVLQGAAGMRVYDPRYVALARELTRRHGILLVLDEVFTGYGRTGPMWAAELGGITPDILCTAKGFSGGLLPMAATLVTDQVFGGFLGSPDRAFYYGHTFAGNPLAAAVAREVLAVYRDECILDGARLKAERIARAFERMRDLPGVTAARSLGMMGALEIGAESGYLKEIGWRVYDEARRRGAYLRPLGNVVYIAPALNIEDELLDELLAIVFESVRAVGTSPSSR